MINMSKNKYYRILLYSVISFLVSSLSFVLIPLSSFEGSKLQKALAYMVGFIFWIGLIVGLILTHYLSKIRQKHDYRKYFLPGILCFFRNKKSRFVDILMIILAIAFIIVKTSFSSEILVLSITLSLLVFSVYIHSVLNGNNYAFAVKKGVHR